MIDDDDIDSAAFQLGDLRRSTTCRNPPRSRVADDVARNTDPRSPGSCRSLPPSAGAGTIREPRHSCAAFRRAAPERSRRRHRNRQKARCAPGYRSHRKIRVTAAAISGRRNGSLNELRRGWRKAFTSSALAKRFLFSSSAIQGRPQISGQGMPPFGLSSTGAMIQRFCTEQIICATVPWQDAPCATIPQRTPQSGLLQDQRRVGKQNAMLFAKASKH